MRGQKLAGLVGLVASIAVIGTTAAAASASHPALSGTGKFQDGFNTSLYIRGDITDPLSLVTSTGGPSNYTADSAGTWTPPGYQNPVNIYYFVRPDGSCVQANFNESYVQESGQVCPDSHSDQWWFTNSGALVSRYASDQNLNITAGVPEDSLCTTNPVCLTVTSPSEQDWNWPK